MAFIHGVEHGLERRHWAPPAPGSCAGDCSPEEGRWVQTRSSMGLAMLLALVPPLLTWYPCQKNPVSACPPVFVLMSSPSTYARSYF